MALSSDNRAVKRSDLRIALRELVADFGDGLDDLHRLKARHDTRSTKLTDDG